MKKILYLVVGLTLILSLFGLSVNANNDTTVVYKFNIHKEIAPPVWRLTQKAFAEAKEQNADIILINMNTYGGLLDAADSIRTKILGSKIPVWVFINNNAASAGALISIACDSIFMKPSANIGAATVVDQKGEVLPDKYQSYMRSLMRSTAETKHRDPNIAQAMVDPTISIPGLVDSTKVLTFTAKEAQEYGFCDGIADSEQQILEEAGIGNYVIKEHKETFVDKIIGFLIHPVVSGIIIMVIVGGIYFELQTPGVGFPLLAAIVAAILFFAPFYLEGIASYWEILVFIIGVILIAVEIFVIPGFGVAGILGIVFMLAGLILSMSGSFDFSYNPNGIDRLIISFLVVVIASAVAIIGSFFITRRLFKSDRFSMIKVTEEQDSQDGYIAADLSLKALIGSDGVAQSILRPAGKVEIDGDVYDAVARTGYIEMGDEITVVGFENMQLIVAKK
ncbi:MAG: nodulation protein NfeD [Hyphomicrobiales bacterium]